jgi:hypothetical protein
MAFENEGFSARLIQQWLLLRVAPSARDAILLALEIRPDLPFAPFR